MHHSGERTCIIWRTRNYHPLDDDPEDRILPHCPALRTEEPPGNSAILLDNGKREWLRAPLGPDCGISWRAKLRLVAENVEALVPIWGSTEMDEEQLERIRECFDSKSRVQLWFTWCCDISYREHLPTIFAKISTSSAHLWSSGTPRSGRRVSQVLGSYLLQSWESNLQMDTFLPIYPSTEQESGLEFFEPIAGALFDML
ncbi:hypothetical protein C8J57DRAFT_1248107 [Mycena rebaudengoi]|nr:hypothetical protein C8J57DRAFT_1248107 [Mycena rebaudengoi]